MGVIAVKDELWLYGQLLRYDWGWVRVNYIEDVLRSHSVIILDLPLAVQRLESLGLVSMYQSTDGVSEWYCRARTVQDIAQGIHRLRVNSEGNMFVAFQFFIQGIP